MIDIKLYEDILINLSGQYLIKDIQFVPNLMSWSKENNHDLSEPYSPMKLVATQQDTLTMVMQKKIDDDMLNDVIKNLSIRWSLRDNVTDIDKTLNSIKKRLVFCFLKERAITMKDIGGDEQVEDQWVLDEMATLNFFKE
jgi:hypothetical protein